MEASRSQLVISFSSALLSCSSVAIALCALMLAFYSAYQTRKITRLSARPYVELTFDWNEKGAGWTYRNFGLGPAIVSSFEVSYDGERLRSWDELDRKLGLTGNVMFSVPGPRTISLPYKTGDNTVIFWMPPESRDKLAARADINLLLLAIQRVLEEFLFKRTARYSASRSLVVQSDTS